MLTFLPESAIRADASEAAKMSQIIKQFFFIKCGITVSHSDDMSDAEQGAMAMEEYEKWCAALDQVYPVQAYLPYTTATRNKIPRHQDYEEV